MAVLALATLSVVVPAADAGGAVASTGTFTLTTPTPTLGQSLTFHYAIDAASVPAKDDNWVGIYDTASQGPVNQVYSGHGSTVYQYVHGTSGDVTFSAADLASLTRGTKSAFLLYDDGYQWLAKPLAFTELPASSDSLPGSLSLATADPVVGTDVSFYYSETRNDSATNWVAIYDDPDTGPIDQTYSGTGSTVYSYVPNSSGTVSISTASLTAGPKIAYFLHDDGYTWLARPVSFYVTGGVAPSANGTLTITSTSRTAGDDITFHYATATPNPLNWVALYADPASGPTDQIYHQPSSTYQYVAGSSGDVTLSTASVGPGTHTAYFLYDDGYHWLAQPITFTLTAPVIPPKPAFLVHDIWAGYVSTGGAARQSLSGLWNGSGGTYTKTGGDKWLSVSATGLVTGTAPSKASAQPATIDVTATNEAGDSATITVEFTVVKGAVPQLKTASWNLWDAGRHVEGGQDKEMAAILNDRLDVVGLQQTQGSAAKDLAKRLGWYSYQSSGDLGILSRYPLTPQTAPTAALPAASATIRVGGRSITVWTTDLDTTGYGPYALCLSGRSTAAVIAAEQSSLRYRQAAALTRAMKSDIKQGNKIPLILLGDLSSPSTLDWTAATAARHCAVGKVSWPVTDLVTKAGLTDSYRAAHPSAQKSPGSTWSPLFDLHSGTSTAEPQDRIDYVEFTGRIKVLESHALITGFPKQVAGSLTDPAASAGTAITPTPALSGNSWPSDHAAAVTTFTL